MLHGRVVRPAAIGATLLSVDESWVKDVPGLVKVVRQDNFLGVVAEGEWGAIRAAQKLKANWSNWEGLPEQSKLWEHRSEEHTSELQSLRHLGCRLLLE